MSWHALSIWPVGFILAVWRPVIIRYIIRSHSAGGTYYDYHSVNRRPKKPLTRLLFSLMLDKSLPRAADSTEHTEWLGYLIYSNLPRQQRPPSFSTHFPSHGYPSRTLRRSLQLALLLHPVTDSLEQFRFTMFPKDIHSQANREVVSVVSVQCGDSVECLLRKLEVLEVRSYARRSDTLWKDPSSALDRPLNKHLSWVFAKVLRD